MPHADLRRKLFAGGVVALLAGTFGVVGLVAPDLLEWPDPVPTAVRIALLLLVALPVLWTVALTHHGLAAKLLGTSNPLIMYLDIEKVADNDGTSYYAKLRHAPADVACIRVAVHAPRWMVEQVPAGTQVAVFMHPKSGRPLVIQRGAWRLWSLL